MDNSVVYRFEIQNIHSSEASAVKLRYKSTNIKSTNICLPLFQNSVPQFALQRKHQREWREMTRFLYEAVLTWFQTSKHRHCFALLNGHLIPFIKLSYPPAEKAWCFKNPTIIHEICFEKRATSVSGSIATVIDSIYTSYLAVLQRLRLPNFASDPFVTTNLCKIDSFTTLVFT